MKSASNLRCFICDKKNEEVEPTYLRIIGARHLGLEAHIRWVTIRCLCCEDCFEEVRAITRARMRALMLWIVTPVIAFVLSFTLLYLVFRNEQALIAVLMVVSLLWMVGLGVLVSYLSRLSRRRIPELLGHKRDKQLRELGELSSWGAGRHLVALREIPANEPYEDWT